MSRRVKLTQKQIERWQFDRFVQLSGELQGRLAADCEEPDFLVQGDAVVGVELTDLLWEQVPGTTPHQATESLRARIAELAGRKYEAKGLPALHVSIHFNPSFVPAKRDVEPLSEKLADLVASNVPEEGGSFEEDYDWENRAYFPEQANHVSAWRFPQFTESFFSSPGAAFIPELSRSDIERALALKEPKVATYKLKCRDAWLVINCDGGWLSSVFEFNEDVVGEVYECKRPTDPPGISG
jgi:hypothetical protein